LTAGEWEAIRDWQTGALVVHVLDVIAQFVHLHDERSDPYLDIQVKLLNAGVQPTRVEPEIRGRVHVFDQDFTHPPELRQIESSNVTRSPEQDSQLPRNERITFLLRQHVKAGRILSQWPVESCRTRARC